MKKSVLLVHSHLSGPKEAKEAPLASVLKCDFSGDTHLHYLRLERETTR